MMNAAARSQQQQQQQQLHKLAQQAADMPPLNETLLISELQGRRPIWDKNHELHTQRDLIEALWSEVATVVGVPVSRARTKWKNLKDSFRREAKRVLMEPNYRPRWRLYNSLLFLYNNEQADKIAEAASDVHSSSYLEPDQTPVSKFEFEYDNTQEHPAESDTKERILNKIPMPNFEMVNTDTFDQEAHMYQLKNGALDADDADLCFFRSLVPHMKELSPQKRMHLRIKIHEMVYKEIYIETHS